jgi:SAM-dependent methyltransferase
MTRSATPRGLVFGTAAESYERFRLGYPDEVVERTVRYAARPVRSAVEVGAGTGKATRAFASRGIAVTAVEPDAEMFSVLQRETAGMPVVPVLSTYEEYDGPPTDLLYAASAMHWTTAGSRWSHAARLLAPGGTVAVFGAEMRLADHDVRSAFDQARSQFLDDDSYPHEPFEGIEAAGLFSGITEEVLPRHVLVPQREFVGYLSTVSAYLLLPLALRQQALTGIADALPDPVWLDVTVHLHLARRAG